MSQADETLTASSSLANTISVVSTPFAPGMYHLHVNVSRAKKEYHSSCFSLIYRLVGPPNDGKAAANLPIVMSHINESAFDEQLVLQNIALTLQFYTITWS